MSDSAASTVPTSSSRNTLIETWGAVAISVLMIGAWIALMVMLVTRTIDGQLALGLIGANSGFVGGIMNYWVGSARGSKTKDGMLTDALNSQARQISDSTTALANSTPVIPSVVKP